MGEEFGAVVGFLLVEDFGFVEGGEEGVCFLVGELRGRVSM